MGDEESADRIASHRRQRDTGQSVAMTHYGDQCLSGSIDISPVETGG